MVGVGRSNDRVIKRDDGLERPWYGERFGNLKVVQQVEHMVKRTDMSGRRCLLRVPWMQSLKECGSSGVGSSHRSYSFSFALPGGGDVEDDQANHGKDVSLFRLASLNKLEFPFFILGSLAAAINGVTFPIFGLLLSSAIYSFFEPHHKLKKYASFWALMYIFLEIGWFDENEKSRWGRSCEMFFINLTLSFFFSGVISARLSANDATVHSMLALLILALVPMLGLQGWVPLRFMRGFSADAKVMYEEASQVTNDVIGSIRTVASFCVEDKYMPSAFGWGLVLLKMGRQLLVFFALTMAALEVSQSTSLALDASKDGIIFDEQITAVVEASNAHKFISGLPQGYNTNVGERWVQLSGGQKQRIAISRAILKDPRILLLDEATSSLDAESKCIVQDALDRVMVDRSTIVVAHNLSTIKDVDLIAMVKNGVIIE
eukprot:Gb_35397 [translate_table: standard]